MSSILKMPHSLQLSAPYHLCQIQYVVAIPPGTLTKTQYYRIIGHEKFGHLYNTKMLNGLDILYLKLGYVSTPSFEYWLTNILPDDMKKAQKLEMKANEEAHKKKLKQMYEKRLEQEAKKRISEQRFETAVQAKIQQLTPAGSSLN